MNAATRARDLATEPRAGYAPYVTLFRLPPTREIPVLETDRLVLRGHRTDDFDDCVAMWADPAVTRHTIGAPSPPQRTWLRILSYLGHWSLLGFGYWAVEDKASRKYVGELGFAEFKRDMQPPIEGSPELGWALVTHAHGKGFATEALRAAVAWGDAHFGETTTVCIISPENRASLRVAEKIGFHEVGPTAKGGTPEILLARRARAS